MPDKKIRAITYNWRCNESGHQLFDYAKIKEGEHPGNPVVIEIIEHTPKSEGRKYFDIIYEDDTVKRIFNPHEVFYEPIVTK